MLQRRAGVHRLSVDDVYAMVAAGVLDEDDRTELADGVVVHMVPIGAEHDAAVIDPLPRTVTVRRRPLAGAYEEVVTYADGESVHALVDGAPVVSVSELLGPAVGRVCVGVPGSDGQRLLRRAREVQVSHQHRCSGTPDQMPTTGGDIR